MECFAIWQPPSPQVCIFNIFKQSSLILVYLQYTYQPETAKQDRNAVGHLASGWK